MTDVGDMIWRMEQTIPLIYDIIGLAIEESRKDAIFFNQEQLLEGLKADGTNLKPYKSASYAKLKRTMNARPPEGIADAHFTGELFDTMFIRTSGETITFDAGSEHAVFMENRDGLEIFGLSPESIQKYKEIYMPIAQTIVRQRTVGIY